MASDQENTSRTVPIFLRAVRAAGADAEALARRFGLGAEVIDLPAVRTSLSVVRELPMAAAALLGEPGLGVRLAAEIPPGLYGWAEQLVRFAPTLRQSLLRVESFGPLLDDRCTFLLRPDGEDRSLLLHSLALPGRTEVYGPQANALILCYFVRVTRELVQRPDWAPPEVAFAHAAPAELPALVRFLGTEQIRFGAGRNQVSYQREVLDQPLTTRDPAISATLLSRAEELLAAAPRDFWGELRRQIAQRLCSETCAVDEVARAMALSTRTLQRRLAEEALSFSQVVDEVRFELASRWLAEGGVSRGEIARRLGYASMRGFARAWERWTGKGPEPKV